MEEGALSKRDPHFPLTEDYFSKLSLRWVLVCL